MNVRDQELDQTAWFLTISAVISSPSYKRRNRCARLNRIVQKLVTIHLNLDGYNKFNFLYILHANFQVSLWLVATLSICGNIGSVVYKVSSQRKDLVRLGHNIFIVCLCLSDTFMGLYLTLVGAADVRYRGQYVWFESSWRESWVCTVAGFLSLVSSETSALIICLITIDR